MEGRSLWEAVHAFVTERGVVGRKDVLKRFHRDEEATVRAVLQDLVESGLVYRAGVGQTASYRVATRDDLAALGDEGRDPEGLDTLVWGVVYRGVRVTRADLERTVPLPPRVLDEALERLVRAARLERFDADGRVTYGASGFVIPVGSSSGWEAAVFDHFQAVVATMCAKTRSDATSTAAGDTVGGSTYTLEIWSGHPLEEEVLGELARFRERVGTLRRRVADHNRSAAMPEESVRVVIYGGQNVLEVSGGKSDETNGG
jgi:hypothetical protein